MKNRTREICTSGSVRDEAGNPLIYSAAGGTPRMRAVDPKRSCLLAVKISQESHFANPGGTFCHT